MGASTLISQRPLPFPETQSTRYPSHASTAMNTPNDRNLGARPASPLTGAAPRALSHLSSSTSAHLSSNISIRNLTNAPSTSILNPSGAISDRVPSSGFLTSSSHSSQSGVPPLYSPGHMTGSWPTPGASQHSYTYGGSNSATPGPGSLPQSPYGRGPTAYGSAPSPSHQHFPGRSATSNSHGDSLPTLQSYPEQSGFSGPGGAGGIGGGAGGLGSPLSPHSQGGNQHSGLTQPMLGAGRLGTTGHGAPGGTDTVQEGSSYRHPPTPTSYYPPASAAQQPFSSYVSPVTQPSPTSATSATSGPIGRGPSSIPAMTSPLQFSSGRSHQIPSMASYASYSSVPGPVLSNMHHPGAPLAMVGGMTSMPSYNHPSLSGNHPHNLYVHHGGGPAPQSERPFKCNGCQQAFNRNHDLKRHQRIHLEIKPFACDDCEKRFSRKDALKTCQGMRRHPLTARCDEEDDRRQPGFFQ